MKLKKIEYNSFDALLKQLIYFITTLLSVLLVSTYLIANEIGYKEIISNGRAVIIDGNLDLAKKRALEDALYLASIQGGARVDGYSSVDSSTNLNETLLVRPSSTIKDFVIIDENVDESHYNVKIKAILVSVNDFLNCSSRNFVNLTFLSSHFSISSRLPPWTSKLPNSISSEIKNNLNNIDFLNLTDASKTYFNPNKVLKKSMSLDYNNLVEGKKNSLRNGEFAVHPIIKLDYAKGRLNRISKEIMVDIILNIYEGPNFNLLDSMNYQFSLWAGNKTGYDFIDAFLRVSEDKLRDFVDSSVSKIQFRVLDKLKCQPLQAEIELVNNKLIVPIGLNQGLKKGTVGFVSNSRDVIMSEWVVLTVSSSEENSAVLEPLNPLNKRENIKGKKIKFLN
ncbi:MAG: hypothetical protein CBC25_01350 [Pelagibacteraceae bacterium TMED65]|nr:hypothetical protein [Rickettsiales bacterium]OUU53134.1 MAG: hypothetical protein CBC25_01350 [Pelagibacteraceae bacterium TMED65]